VHVWGFGSFFKHEAQFKDIDLLLVHGNLTTKSLLLALRSRRALVYSCKLADVSILSKSAEKEYGFIAQTGAMFLGLICGDTFDCDISNLINEISRVRPEQLWGLR
jgi:hypothetical protein